MSAPDPLRALFVQSQTEIGGAEVSLLNTLRALDRTRVEPAVAVLGFGQGNFPDRMREAGIKVFELKSGRLRNPFGWLCTVGKLARIARREGFGALVANGYHPHLYSHPAARLAKACSLVFCHDLPRARGQAVLIERLSYALRPEGYLVPGRAVAEAVAQRTGRADLVKLIPNGVSLERFRPDPEAAAALRAELGLDPDCPVVTVVGRLHPGKGQHVFIEAAARVASEVPAARFLVVGAALFGMHANYPGELRAQAARLGLAEQVIFAGSRADMPALYAASDVVALTSVAPEAFPMVVIEAMAAARAVVTPRIGGASEAVVEEVSGLTFEPGAAGELAGRLLRLCRDRDLRARLGQAARERVRENYSAEASARALTDALDSLVSRKSSGLNVHAPERIVPGRDDPGNVALQEARYRYALGKLPGGLVLDLGCGIGTGAGLVAEAGFRVVGVDLEPEALREATTHWGKGAAGYLAADALKLPFGDRTFDSVICFELMEHVREQLALLDEIRRVLKPGGTLLLSTPNRLTEQTLALPGGPGICPYHIGTPDPRQLRRLLASRFQILDLLAYRRRGSRIYALLRSLDYFNLRLRLSGRMRRSVAQAVGAPTVKPASQPEDFVPDRRGIRQANSLLAVCRRPAAASVARLVVLSAAYPPDIGGVADHSRMLARALAERGCEVEVVTTSRGGPSSPEGFRVTRLAEGWSLGGVRRMVSKLASGPAKAILFQYVPHLYGRGGLAAGAAALPLLARRRGLPVLTAFHEVGAPWSLNPLIAAQAAAHRAQAAALAAGSEAVVLSNARYARIMRWALRLFDRPWAVLPSGPTAPPVEMSDEQRSRERTRWARPGESLVTTYGLARRDKRYDLAVGALELLRRGGHGVRLLMLGDQEAGDADYCREIRQKVRQLGLEEWVTWSGPLPPEDISKALAVSDCVWNLEGAGITTRNGSAACALLLGAPLLTFRGWALDSCFQDGDNVLTVAEVSARGLAEVTAQLLSSPELAAKLRVGARRLHDEVFAWPVIAESYLRLLQCAGVDVG